MHHRYITHSMGLWSIYLHAWLIFDGTCRYTLEKKNIGRETHYFFKGDTSSNGGFPIATLDYRSVNGPAPLDLGYDFPLNRTPSDPSGLPDITPNMWIHYKLLLARPPTSIPQVVEKGKYFVLVQGFKTSQVVSQISSINSSI